MPERAGASSAALCLKLASPEEATGNLDQIQLFRLDLAPEMPPGYRWCLRNAQYRRKVADPHE